MRDMESGVAREALSCECGTQLIWNYTKMNAYRQGISLGYIRIAFHPVSAVERVPFPWPQTRAAHPVLPVFLPFAGCPARCVFCAQDKQTGVETPGSGSEGVARALDLVSAALEERAIRQAAPVEVAFFGGTFSAQPENIQEACFARLRPWRERGLVAAVRCSTRPDAVSPGRLQHLKALGLDTVELGVQSFSSRALSETGRGYTREQAADACRRVREAGFALGVQLMPGMPGADAAVFQADVAQALDLGADFLRFYPCLVLEGTELARLWRAGAYVPWDLELTVRELARALLTAGKAGVPVIRMGLPLSGDFTPHIPAGPAHPALGALVQAEALHHYIYERVAGRSVAALYPPRSCRGFFWGDKGGMRERWAALGLHRENVVWTETPHHA